MTTVSVNGIVFASLIAAAILPFLATDIAYAEELTDRQLIDEWNETFRNDIDESTGGTEPSDEIKISVMRGIHEAKDKAGELSDYQINYEKEQDEVLEIARSLHEMIESAPDPETKAILEQALNDLKPRMAEVGIFMPGESDDEELNVIHDRYQEGQRDSFRSAKMDPKHAGISSGMSASVDDQYQTQMFLEYTCEPFVCRSEKILDYVDPGESTTATIPVPSDISAVNTTEWRIKVGNLQASQWQSGYHQAIHYDEDWNYQSGAVKSSNKYYPYNSYVQYTVYSVYNAEAGDQTY